MTLVRIVVVDPTRVAHKSRLGPRYGLKPTGEPMRTPFCSSFVCLRRSTRSLSASSSRACMPTTCQESPGTFRDRFPFYHLHSGLHVVMHKIILLSRIRFTHPLYITKVTAGSLPPTQRTVSLPRLCACAPFPNLWYTVDGLVRRHWTIGPMTARDFPYPHNI